ncbi:helix-turn-helix domain-containing protein [Rhodopseudomonas palustris]|nr:helix-turn-helix domain-containing protein [Rhodopseudomonas palustris]
MSWQATAWAAKQRTGSPACKLILLALANYADANGAAWPSQETLAADTEQSVDSVQRRLKQLVKLGLIRAESLPAKRGQWAGRIYLLNMPVAEMSKPQFAARSSMACEVPDGGAAEPAPVPSRANERADRAATETVTVPQPERSPCRKALRHKPSEEQSIEQPSNISITTEPRAKAAAAVADRLMDFRAKQEGSEVVQNRIAQRIGADGWLVLGEMSDQQRALLTTLERRGELDDVTLGSAAARARCARPP